MTPLRKRDMRTVQAATGAFLSSSRYANPNTRRLFVAVIDALTRTHSPDRGGGASPLRSASQGPERAH
jgi:hypothetical protein